MKTNKIIIQTTKKFLFYEIDDLILNSTFPEPEINRLHNEFIEWINGVTDWPLLVEISNYLYSFDESTDCCEILESALKKYKQKGIRTGRTTVIKKE